MRSLLAASSAAALCAACSTSAGTPSQAEYPSLTPDGARDARSLTSAASTRCIPAGPYQISIDVSTATFAATGAMSESWCTAQGTAFAEASGGPLEIAYPNGRLAVSWPQPVVNPWGERVVTPRGDCGLSIPSAGSSVLISFVDGMGVGRTSFQVTTPHADESCHVRDATIRIGPAPPAVDPPAVATPPQP